MKCFSIFPVIGDIILRNENWGPVRALDGVKGSCTTGLRKRKRNHHVINPAIGRLNT